MYPPECYFYIVIQNTPYDRCFSFYHRGFIVPLYILPSSVDVLWEDDHGASEGLSTLRTFVIYQESVCFSFARPDNSYRVFAPAGRHIHRKAAFNIITAYILDYLREQAFFIPTPLTTIVS
jgi:hypothetical protein